MTQGVPEDRAESAEWEALKVDVSDLTTAFAELSGGITSAQDLVDLLSASRRSILRTLLIGRTQRDVAALVGLSQQRVGQLLTERKRAT